MSPIGDFSLTVMAGESRDGVSACLEKGLSEGAAYSAGSLRGVICYFACMYGVESIIFGLTPTIATFSIVMVYVD